MTSSVRAELVKLETDTAKSTIIRIDEPVKTDYDPAYEFEVPSCNMPVAESIVQRAKEENRRIAIRATRLEVLQTLEREMPELIEKAMNELNKKKLESLRERDKTNPDAVKARTKKYVETHREEINARRRERYQTQKACAGAGGQFIETHDAENPIVTPRRNHDSETAPPSPASGSSVSTNPRSPVLESLDDGSILHFR